MMHVRQSFVSWEKIEEIQYLFKIKYRKSIPKSCRHDNNYFKNLEYLYTLLRIESLYRIPMDNLNQNHNKGLYIITI